MIKNKLIILSSITITVIVAATVFANLRAPQSQKEKTLFFPELAKQIESVSYISIKGFSDSINLTRKNNVWGIDEFDGYPALADKIKSTVLGAADLKINAPKTRLPRLYHRLGVEGPDVENTDSLLLTLYDSNKTKIIEVIIGKPRLSSSAKNISGLYVRKPEDEKSYLVDGVLDVSSIKTNWIMRNLFDVPAESIKSAALLTIPPTNSSTAQTGTLSIFLTAPTSISSITPINASVTFCAKQSNESKREPTGPTKAV